MDLMEEFLIFKACGCLETESLISLFAGKVFCSSRCIGPFLLQIFKAYCSSYAAQIHLPDLPWDK